MLCFFICNYFNEISDLMLHNTTRKMHCHFSQKYSKTDNIYLRQQIRSTYHPVIGVFVG